MAAMRSEALLRAGKLGEAIQVLGAEMRDAPLDVKRRVFLFELLCYAGEYDRAQKHLDYLANAGQDAAMGALVYHAALHAERTRQEMFAGGGFPAEPAEAEPEFAGTLNGKPFAALEDADPRIRGRLEVFAGGTYLWIPWHQIATVEIPPPKRLRDLLWAPALVRTGPAFRGTELGEVLLPVISPLSWRHANDNVRLGRMTVWEDSGQGFALPFGQKMLLVDEEEIPVLEARKIEIQPAAS
jgi:type VI secretion system protein ImpE